MVGASFLLNRIHQIEIAVRTGQGFYQAGQRDLSFPVTGIYYIIKSVIRS